MATVYVRRFDLKESLSQSEVAAFWNFMTQEFLPACSRVNGLRSVRLYSGQGGVASRFAGRVGHGQCRSLREPAA